MADIFGDKIIQIHIFICEVSKYMFWGSVNMNMRFRKRTEVTIFQYGRKIQNGGHFVVYKLI